jgi:hypothetical protein
MYSPCCQFIRNCYILLVPSIASVQYASRTYSLAPCKSSICWIHLYVHRVMYLVYSSSAITFMAVVC